jgi:hypothetical protein
MACKRCIEALEAAGQVLHELRSFEPHTLPAGTNWQEVAENLIFLAGKLRIEHTSTDLL